MDIQPCILSWNLTSTLLLSSLLLPALTAASLLCNFCPLQHKSKSCTNITSECLPHQHCSSSRGRYGSVHVLSSQGCLDAKLCDSHEMISYRGVEYNISHTCCCTDGCNHVPQSSTNLLELLGMNKDNPEYNTNTRIKRELWDSCVNYTNSISFKS